MNQKMDIYKYAYFSLSCKHKHSLLHTHETHEV